jgi:hypothetical protein
MFRNLIIIFCFVMTSFAQTVGVNPWLWVSTYTQVNTPGLTQTPCSGENGDWFFSQLKTYSNAIYPQIDVLRYLDRRESAVTNIAFRSGESSPSEIVFFEGHGNYGDIDVWDGQCGLQNMYFINYTKWIFLHSCLTLGDYNNNSWRMNSFFSHGAHAVFGFGSNSYQYQRVYRCGFLWHTWCYECRDKHMWDNFFGEWIVNSRTMWEAYAYAGYRLYQETGNAIELVAYGSSVWWSPTQQTIWGAEEKCAQVYSNGMCGSWRERLVIIEPAGGQPVY